jgi:hypothetical protein
MHHQTHLLVCLYQIAHGQQRKFAIEHTPKFDRHTNKSIANMANIQWLKEYIFQ